MKLRVTLSLEQAVVVRKLVRYGLKQGGRFHNQHATAAQEALWLLSEEIAKLGPSDGTPGAWPVVEQGTLTQGILEGSVLEEGDLVEARIDGERCVGVFGADEEGLAVGVWRQRPQPGSPTNLPSWLGPGEIIGPAGERWLVRWGAFARRREG